MSPRANHVERTAGGRPDRPDHRSGPDVLDEGHGRGRAWRYRVGVEGSAEVYVLVGGSAPGSVWFQDHRMSRRPDSTN